MKTADFNEKLKNYECEIQIGGQMKAELEHQVSREKENIQRVKESKNKFEEEMKSRIEIVAIENTHLKERLEDAKKEIKSMKTKQADCTSQLENREKELKNERDKSGSMQKKIEELKREKSYCEEKLEESHRMCDELLLQ